MPYEKILMRSVGVPNSTSIGVYKAMGATPVMTMTTIMIGTGGAAGGGPRPGMVGTAAMTYP